MVFTGEDGRIGRRAFLGGGTAARRAPQISRKYARGGAFEVEDLTKSDPD